LLGKLGEVGARGAWAQLDREVDKETVEVNEAAESLGNSTKRR
jgi:hypothetical protein